MGTNPAVSLPDADRVRAALGGSSCWSCPRTSNDTLPPAHVRLPAAGGREGRHRHELERRISRQRPFLPLPGEARPDWAILADVGRRLGWREAFAYNRPADIFREHARLSGFENDGARAFDISALAEVTDAEYDALAPVQWPFAKGGTPAERVFANGGFAPPRRARFVKIAPPRLAATPSAKYPFVLNTGRVRDQWRTMTRTGLSPRLSVHVAEPFVEIHPRDAAELGFAQGTLARVSTRYGSAILRVMLSEGQQRGSVFVPIHWSAQNSSAGASVRSCSRRPTHLRAGGKGHPGRDRARAVSHYGFVLTRGSPRASTASPTGRAAMPAGFVTFLGLDLPSRRLAGAARPPAAGRRAHVLRGRAQRPLPRRRAARGPARGGALPLAGPDAALARMAEGPVRARRSRRPSGAPCSQAERWTALRTRDRSSACAIRSAASASKADRRRRTRPMRSARERAPARIAARACPSCGG